EARLATGRRRAGETPPSLALARGEKTRAEPPREPLGAATHYDVVIPCEDRLRERAERVHRRRRRLDPPLPRGRGPGRPLVQPPATAAGELPERRPPLGVVERVPAALDR